MQGDYGPSQRLDEIFSFDFLSPRRVMWESYFGAFREICGVKNVWWALRGWIKNKHAWKFQNSDPDRFPVLDPLDENFFYCGLSTFPFCFAPRFSHCEMKKSSVSFHSFFPSVLNLTLISTLIQKMDEKAETGEQKVCFSFLFSFSALIF